MTWIKFAGFKGKCRSEPLGNGLIPANAFGIVVALQVGGIFVDREVRAHLLSHGRTRGVQGQHYERYDFLDEKRRALRKWAAHLERVIEGKPQARVAAIRAA